ncbi:hypothetical protein DPMN_173347 [Dreissena polymorpha]|uniref:Uncharacterized protein n=1 Tax=Dreissena polymorpha TaxID=45954 RepID=A0A9D4E427_DREPO|nr:hypothetical protein DPMN_173347 [Dreissena polymorpha]
MKSHFAIAPIPLVVINCFLGVPATCARACVYVYFIGSDVDRRECVVHLVKYRDLTAEYPSSLAFGPMGFS